MLSFLSNKKMIIIISIVIIVVLLVLFLTYRAGKKSADASKVKVPSDVIGIPLSTEEEQYLNGLAINLHNDMEGMNFIGWNNDLYNEVSLLSDSKLAALSNIFNFKFEQESEQTFLQWLENENFGWENFNLANSVNIIKNRLRNLGVS